MSTITIKDDRELLTAKATGATSTKHKLDLQDIFVVLGFLGIEIGIGLIYVPAALIFAGIWFMSAALLLEKAKARGNK